MTASEEPRSHRVEDQEQQHRAEARLEGAAQDPQQDQAPDQVQPARVQERVGEEGLGSGRVGGQPEVRGGRRLGEGESAREGLVEPRLLAPHHPGGRRNAVAPLALGLVVAAPAVHHLAAHVAAQLLGRLQIGVRAQVVAEREGTPLFVAIRLDDVDVVGVRPVVRPAKERAEGIVGMRQVEVADALERRDEARERRARIAPLRGVTAN